MDIDVKEASQRLGVNESRVRQLLRSGELQGRILGNSWVIPAEDVARLQHAHRKPGRPLAPKRAWAVLNLLDGGSADWLSDSARSQVRRYLAALENPSPQEWNRLLRRRSQIVEARAHPAAISRLKRAESVLPSGQNAAVERGFDLVVIDDPIPEFYVANDHYPQLLVSMALREAKPANIKIRIPREVWPFFESQDGGHASVGDAYLAADLLESAEPRAIVAGGQRLNELLSEWKLNRR